MSSRSNVEVGREFCSVVRHVSSEKLGMPLREEVGIGIGSPPKAHRFDLANATAKVVIECKAFTWTKTDKMPSAKIIIAREAILYLQWLPRDWTRILAMSRSIRTTHVESLAEYFVRLNRHLLGDVVVVEVDDNRARVFHGAL